MTRRRSLIGAALAAVCSAALLVTACGAPTTGRSASEDMGPPVSGGRANLIQVTEPRSLDPAALGNVWATQPALGNALYGTLMINNADTGEIEYKMAEDFSTADGGATYILRLRPGLRYTDDTPLDAAAVKYNWDRMKDPKLGAGASKVSPQIAQTTVLTPTTLRVSMIAPNQHFAQAVVTSTLNWTASPSALEKGRAAFDAAPVGAGPFTLASWTRQDKMELVKNQDYWDAPKPYLDGVTFRFVPDTAQRFNAVLSGAADLASETNSANVAKAKDAGLTSAMSTTGGGYYLAMNNRRAPFDDPRARKAISLALDLDTINTIVNNAAGTVPRTLFTESSPFYSDITLAENNRDEARALFDELAREGKRVAFAYTSFSTTESKLTGEAIQAQLSDYDNVEVRIDALDSSAINSVVAKRDFDMVVTTANVLDPDTELWAGFHSSSKGNMTGVHDTELDAALDAGRVGATVEERKSAYDTVQRELAEQVPGLFYVRSAPSVIAGADVGGVKLYGLGSPLPEEIWLTN
ncbi:ABC transporter substrate-binding protein [Gordonia sp. CPCC 206044]|uniref:ABC transporter substrate-binding protein n=1 Tax=Gordonia sp. CPCC 206044 TaxID=3140793 RepID=UPI003AF3EDF7